MPEENVAEQPAESVGTSNTEAEQMEQQVSESDFKDQISKLRRENAKYRTERNELREAAEKWAEHERSQKSELERLQEDNAAFQQQLKEASLKNDRYEVASNFEIPAAQLSLLTADTREGMEEQATAIVELVRAAGHRPPSNRPVEGLPPGVAKKQAAPDEYPASWRPKNLRD